MKAFLLLALLLGSCATARHDTQAPPRARHDYHQQQRKHAHQRRRAPTLPCPGTR